jgi:hypothetical protein
MNQTMKEPIKVHIEVIGGVVEEVRVTAADGSVVEYEVEIVDHDTEDDEHQ